MKKILLPTCCLMMFAACTTEKTDTPEMYGEISVTLSDEVVVDVDTKTFEELLPDSQDAADYMVFIHSGEDLIYEAAYNAFETQKLPLGTYLVSAENCTEEEAETGTGQKRLYGQTEVTLSVDDLTPEVDVECVVSNSLVTVEFAPEVLVSGRFSDLQVSVTGGDSGRTQTVSATDTPTEIWFNPSEVSYSITGTFIPTGKDVSMEGKRTLAAKNHMKLVVSVNLDNGQISATPSISVDTAIDDEIPVEEEFNPYE